MPLPFGKAVQTCSYLKGSFSLNPAKALFRLVSQSSQRIPLPLSANRGRGAAIDNAPLPGAQRQHLPERPEDVSDDAIHSTKASGMHRGRQQEPFHRGALPRHWRTADPRAAPACPLRKQPGPAEDASSHPPSRISSRSPVRCRSASKKGARLPKDRGAWGDVLLQLLQLCVAASVQL